MKYIISCPRSGSTWLSSLLSYLPGVFVSENRYFGGYFDVVKTPNNREVLRSTADAYFKAFTRHYFQFTDPKIRPENNALFESFLQFIHDYTQKFSGCHTLIDKLTPYKGTAMKALLGVEQYFPQAHKIYLMRDGRDVVTSGVFDWICRETPQYERHDFFLSHNSGKVLHRFFDDDSLVKWTEHWAEIASLIQISGHDTLLVRYEDMIEHTVSELRRICKFFKIDCTEPDLHASVEKSSFFNISGRNRGDAVFSSKMRKGVVGDWQRYFTKRDGVIFNEIAGSLLFEFNYAEEDSWILDLPEKLSLTYK